MVSASDKTTTGLRDELAHCRENNRILSGQLTAKSEQLDRITASLGWRLLSRYGRIKYKYLLPLYRLCRIDTTDKAAQENERKIRESNGCVGVIRWDKSTTPAGNSPEKPNSSSRLCVVCGKDVDAWLPIDIPVSDFMRLVGSVGSSIERFSCPQCQSTDRDRHLRLFLDRVGALDSINGGSVLHMAPEPPLEDYVRSYAPSFYVRGDLNSGDQSIQKIDLQRLPFPDEAFDLLICNHMLEHVDDARAALQEMHRVLKPGARAICQTPYATRLTKTLEDPLLQSNDDRILLYGQYDHVRLFGRDLEELIRDAGFVGRIVPHSELLPDVNPELFGINEREPFFDFVRDGRNSPILS